MPVAEELGAGKLRVYLHDWGQGTRGRRFHLLTASPPGSRIHRYEFLKHNKAWTVTRVHPPSTSSLGGERMKQSRTAQKEQKKLRSRNGVSNGNGKLGKSKVPEAWNSQEINTVSNWEVGEVFKSKRMLRNGCNVWPGDDFFSFC